MIFSLQYQHQQHFESFLTNSNPFTWFRTLNQYKLCIIVPITNETQSILFSFHYGGNDLYSFTTLQPQEKETVCLEQAWSKPLGLVIIYSPAGDQWGHPGSWRGVRIKLGSPQPAPLLVTPRCLILTLSWAKTRHARNWIHNQTHFKSSLTSIWRHLIRIMY